MTYKLARAIKTSPSFQKAEFQSQSLNQQILSKPLPVRSWIFVQSDFNPFGRRRVEG